MKIQWPKTEKEAVAQQRELAQKLILEDAFESPKWLGGMDVSNFLFDPSQRVFASAVVLAADTLTLADSSSVVEKQSFPYIPGLLGFREAPALLHAFEKLTIRPDLIMVDGHGISHPRRLGIASHIGVLLDVPTIGVAKSILCGEPAGPLGDAPGSQTPLLYKGDVVGMLVRTKKNCNPLIISSGHRISLETSLDLVFKALTKYRLPETTRRAHLAANAFRQKAHAHSN